MISPAQGIGKGMGIEALAIDPKYFHRGNPNLDNKDTELLLSGLSIFEFEECHTFIANVKGFLTKACFKLRKPYAKDVEEIPSSCVYMGAANEENLDFLSDPTGSRRFCSMLVGIGGDIRVEELQRDLKYIYARAMHAFHGTGEYTGNQQNKPWLGAFPDGKKLEGWQARSNSRFASADPWIPYVSENCEKQFQKFKEEMERISKRDWFCEEELKKATNQAEKILLISVKTILDDVLKIPIMKQDRKASKRVYGKCHQICLIVKTQKRMDNRVRLR